MPTLDAEHHDLQLRIVIVGGASEAFLQALPIEDGKMHLGQLQGWKPHLEFSAFPTDPWAGDGAAGSRLERLLPHADGLVLTDALTEGQHYSSTAVERLSRALKPSMIRLPAAIYGCHALDEEWTTLAGVKPVCVVEPSPENAMTVVKAICAVLLRSRMKSRPPPPPE